MEPMTPADVQPVLEAFDPNIKILFFETSTATSELAAQAIGCQVSQIAKSICFMVEESPVVVITRGDQQVDDRKVAALFNVGRKKVKMAKADECISIFGYVPGSVPPVAHRTPVKIFLDETLKRHTNVYPAAGSASACFGITLEGLQKLTGGTFADVIKNASGAEPAT
jgi:prolyl-tRNA editing enzyme YbaK/EbsC (Cys-tRNA(Pro) deacylase)